MDTISSNPVIFNSSTILINVLNCCVAYLIVLIIRKIWSRQFNNTKIWTLLRKQVWVKIASVIQNIIPIITSNHSLSVLSVRNEVRKNFIFLKVCSIRLHPIHPNITVIRTDCNRNGWNLSKAIRCFIELNSCWDSINPKYHLSIVSGRKDIKLKLHEVVLTIWGFNRVLLRTKSCSLCIHRKSDATRHTA